MAKLISSHRQVIAFFVLTVSIGILECQTQDSVVYVSGYDQSTYNKDYEKYANVQIQPATTYKVPGDNYNRPQGMSHDTNTGQINYPTDSGGSQEVVPSSRNADTDFSLEMIKILSKQNGNIVISPLSLATLLALLAQGAEGNTLLQLERALNLNKGQAASFYGSVVKNLKNRNTGNDIIFENAIFVQKGNLDGRFKSTAINNFKADVEITEFKNPPLAAGQINQWVSKNTRGKITSIISPESLGQYTNCVLVNAVHFKSVWKTKFDPQKTVNLSFYPNPNQQVTAAFMHISASFPAGEDKAMGAKWVELPFDGSDFSMVFVLPTEQHGLNSLIDRLTKNDLNTIINTKNTENAILSIPKFNIDYSNSLVNVLMQVFTVIQNLLCRVLWDILPCQRSRRYISKLPRKHCTEDL